MKKYVFFAFGIQGLSGAPRYVNNKCRYLKEHGWEVDVFWCYNVSHAQLEHLVPFDKKEYIIHELLFFPCWFTIRQQRSVVERIAQQIGSAEQIVIESCSIHSGAWGELIAKRLKAKHINFVVAEKVMIKNKGTFDYCYAKLHRHEFFTINKAAVKQLFSQFVNIDHPEDYYWSASPGVEVEEYSFPSFDDMPKADFTITSFGRQKAYFLYMLSELRKFFSQHPDKNFNVFFLGDLKNEAEIRESLALDNVHLAICPQAVQVIPLQVFTQSDVIIATAGCAIIASRNGGKVISMDVNNNAPLGLFRYTTWDTNTDSGLYENHLSLMEWLQTLLIDKKEFVEMVDTRIPHYFDYQMQYATPPDGMYLDTANVNENITKNDKVWKCLIKIGLFCLVEILFFTKRKKRKNKQKQYYNNVTIQEIPT